MGSKKKRSPNAMQKQMEAEAARALGKHVSRQKGRILLAVTLAACALPALLGLRLWDQIPEIVPTGLTGPDGKDDSLPRVVVVFGMPGLMCLLDVIAHFQLLFNQKHMTMPSRPVRLVGRMGFPVISVLFCSGLMLQAAGCCCFWERICWTVRRTPAFRCGFWWDRAAAGKLSTIWPEKTGSSADCWLSAARCWAQAQRWALRLWRFWRFRC